MWVKNHSTNAPPIKPITGQLFSERRSWNSLDFIGDFLFGVTFPPEDEDQKEDKGYEAHHWTQRGSCYEPGIAGCRGIKILSTVHTQWGFMLELVRTCGDFQVDVAAVAPGCVAGLAHILSWHAFGQVAQPQRALPFIWKDITIKELLQCYTGLCVSVTPVEGHSR